MGDCIRAGLIAMALAALLPGSLVAAEQSTERDSGAVSDATRERITEALQELDERLVPDRIEATRLPEIYRVQVDGQIAHISGDGRYLIQGSIRDLETGASLSDNARAGVRRELLADHGEDNMIVYRPDDEEVRHTVTVFTDIDCPYCRRFHENMDGYLERGIAVRYVQIPRAGEGSESYDKAVSVWCADDRNAAMDRAKAGRELTSRDCDNPVGDQLELARTLGVQATPTIVTEDGTMHPGFVAPDELLSRLEDS
ncbi:MAG: DsbC family protein [Ectothiorhodospiraceae bacterium]